MYWTLELASKLRMLPTCDQRGLIDYALRSGAPMEVIENLKEIEDEGETRYNRRYLYMIIQPKMISFSRR